MELDRAIALYMNDCRARQLRPKTMLSYEQALKLFAVWLEDAFGITAIGKITADHIRQYIIDLQDRGKYTFCINSSSCVFNHPQNRRDYREKISNCTINNYLRNMHAFFSWLVEQEYLPRSPMQKIKALPVERRAKEFLDNSEVIRILKIMDKSYFPEMRDYSAMMLMLDSGTRLGETLSAKVTQLDLQEKSLHLPADRTKGRKARTVFFSSKTAREIRHWLQFKDRYCESDYLFPVRATGYPIQISDYEKNFRKYCKRAGIKKQASPHTLRNNFAKRCLLAGMDIYSLSRILGHSSVKVTEEAYLDITNTDLKNQYNKYSPIEMIYYK